MKTNEAIEICEGWFDYIERQKERAVEMQKLATLARTDPKEAQHRLRQLDSTPTVYDGGRLEPAVRALVKLARKSAKACDNPVGNGNEEAIALLERIRKIDPHAYSCVEHGENYHGQDCDCEMSKIWVELDQMRNDHCNAGKAGEVQR